MDNPISEVDFRLLVVEDSMLVVEHVGEILDDCSLRLHTRIAQTESEAIAAVRDFEPEIVLLDLRLKKGDGFAVLRELQQRKSKPLVIVMTNYALPNYRYYAKLAGADHFLDKSVDLMRIKTLVQEFKCTREISPRSPKTSQLKFRGLYSVRI